jgi:alcohol oxidase
MTIPEEVDIIICGGGSSGCVPAGRLANLDHNLSVLLIEAGEDNLNNQWYVFQKNCALSYRN